MTEPRTIFRLEVVDRGPSESPEVRYAWAPDCDSWRVSGIVREAVSGGGICGAQASYYVRDYRLADLADPYAWHSVAELMR